jgi:hypothetical protein
MKQRKASSGVRTIGSPRTLGQPVLRLKADSRQGLEARVGLGVNGCAQSNQHASLPEFPNAARRACRCRTAPVLGRHRPAPALRNVGDQQHVGTLDVELERRLHGR